MWRRCSPARLPPRSHERQSRYRAAPEIVPSPPASRVTRRTPPPRLGPRREPASGQEKNGAHSASARRRQPSVSFSREMVAQTTAMRPVSGLDFKACGKKQPPPAAAPGQVHPTASSLASHRVLPAQLNAGLQLLSTFSGPKRHFQVPRLSTLRPGNRAERAAFASIRARLQFFEGARLPAVP